MTVHDARPERVVPEQLVIRLPEVEGADVRHQRVRPGRLRVREDPRVEVEVVIGLRLLSFSFIRESVEQRGEAGVTSVKSGHSQTAMSDRVEKARLCLLGPPAYGPQKSVGVAPRPKSARALAPCVAVRVLEFS